MRMLLIEEMIVELLDGFKARRMLSKKTNFLLQKYNTLMSKVSSSELDIEHYSQIIIKKILIHLKLDRSDIEELMSTVDGTMSKDEVRNLFRKAIALHEITRMLGSTKADVYHSKDTEHLMPNTSNTTPVTAPPKSSTKTVKAKVSTPAASKVTKAVDENNKLIWPPKTGYIETLVRPGSGHYVGIWKESNWIDENGQPIGEKLSKTLKSRYLSKAEVDPINNEFQASFDSDGKLQVTKLNDKV